MPVISSGRVFDGLGPAGGVLAGNYPNPGFAQPMATVNDLAGKADVAHLHAAADVTTGTLSIDRIPTSTESVATAVPRADDPRLTGPRAWNRYDGTANPSVGQVPTWNGSVYTPVVPPSAAPPPDATANSRGVIQLAGDIGGSAIAPVITTRGPLGGHQPAPLSSGVATINAQVSTSFYISATTNITIDPPTSPVDGQRIILEIYASAGAVTAGVSASISSGSGVVRSFTIPSAKVGLFEMGYSTRVTRWILSRTVLEP